MKSLALNPQIVWFKEAATPGTPDLQEEAFDGSLAEAVSLLVTRAKESNGFILGQVLEHDGRVYATIGQGGATRITEQSQSH